jgi:alcohol dehydrogenase
MGAGPAVKALFWIASQRERGLARRCGVRYSYMFMRPDGGQLAELAHLIDAGKLKPIVDRIYPLAEAKAALAYLEAGHAKGKVVVQVRR